jgi:hypothetical protein
VAVFDASKFSEPSTAQAAELLEGWEAAEKSVLVLLDASEEACGKSFRNIARVAVMPVADAGVADVIRAGGLLVSEASLPRLVALAVGSAEAAGGAAEEPEPLPRDDAPEIGASEEKEAAPEDEAAGEPEEDA